MAPALTRWFLVAALICSAVRAENGEEGDGCVTRSGENGVCTGVKKCLPAVTALRQGVPPQVCSFQGSAAIVCCPQGSNNPQVNQGSGDSQGSQGSSGSRGSGDRSRRSAAPEGCPPLPAVAVKSQKTSQKAHDKCLELAEYVYPCETVAPGGPMTRVRVCARDTAPLIPGGYIVGPGEFPHMAALGIGEWPDIRWTSGGTLVSERWVLTAAHFVFSHDLRGRMEYARVLLGGGDLNSTASADIFTVSRAVVHPEFSRASVYYDIALLQLDRPVTFSRSVRPACLHTGPPGPETKVLATGWGADNQEGSISNSLHKVTLDIFTHDECARKFPASRKLLNGLNESTQLCAGPKSGRADTCQGDGGGPLQVINPDVDCTYLVFGITSFGRACGVTGRPSVFTRVSAFIPWIESVVWP